MDNNPKQSVVNSVGGQIASTWKSGKQPDVERLLHQSSDFASLSDDDQREAVISLLRLEIDLRRQSGQPLEVSHLAERFPKLDRADIESLVAQPALPPMAGEPQLPERFEMLEEVGRGGIGSVWRVNDTRMGRQLAIKLLLSRFRNSQQANERLKRESLLAGSLQHPGIPPVHEFGTMVDGAVYFSMKLVEGQTLGKMLAKRESGANDRSSMLNIFEQVAQTMAYAHEQGVIHRDLKPHNIMVGRFGEVQVMDWGMAKRLGQNDGPSQDRNKTAAPFTSTSQTPTMTNHGDDTPNVSMNSSIIDPLNSLTQAGDVLGTPAYMAPEQARGEIADLSPASDVFGLGAILFEILTGSRLYGSETGSQNVLTQAAEGAVEPSLRKLDELVVDERLASLCRRCLQPQAADRPPTASHIAEEITDYFRSVQDRLKQVELEKRSVEVRVAEERKRRRLAIFLGSAIAAAVLAGLLGVLWQRNNALSSAAEAKQSAKGYADVLDIVTKSFNSVNPLEGSDAQMTAREVLLNTVGYLNDSDLDDEGRMMLLAKLSTCFRAIGEYDVAVPTAEACLELTNAKLGPDHPDTYQAINNLGAIYTKTGRLDEAIPLLKQTLTRRMEKLGEDHPDTITSMEDLASCYTLADRSVEAIPILEEVLAARRDIVGIDHPDTKGTMDILAAAYLDAPKSNLDSLVSINNLAASYILSGQHLKALRMWEDTLDAFEHSLGENHPTTLMFSHNMVVALVQAGYAKEGVQLGERTLAGRVKKLGADHPETMQSMNNLAQAYERAGQFEDAVKLFQRTVSAYEQKMGAAHTSTLTAIIGLGNSLRQVGRIDEAISLLETHRMVAEEAFGPGHHLSVTCINNLCAAYSEAGKSQDALRLGKQVLVLRKANQGMQHPGTLFAMNNLATFYMRANLPEEALSLIDEAFRASIELHGPTHPDTLYFSNNLAEANRRAGNLKAAQSLFEKTLAAQQENLGEDHPDTLRSMNGLAHTLNDLGQSEKSVAAYIRVLGIRKSKLGSDHPDTLYSMHGLAGALRDSGRSQKAISLFQTVLLKRRATLGKEHPRTIQSLNELVWMQATMEGAEVTPKLLEAMRQACEKLPRPNFLRTLAYAEYGASNYQAAIDAAQLIPESELNIDPISQGILAISYLRLGATDAAQTHKEKFDTLPKPSRMMAYDTQSLVELIDGAFRD